MYSIENEKSRKLESVKPWLTREKERYRLQVFACTGADGPISIALT